MAITRCPHCEVLILPEETRNGNCPSCGGSLDGRNPPRRPSSTAPAPSTAAAGRGTAPAPPAGGIVVPLLLVLLLLGLGVAAFTGFVAYCGMHPFALPDAFENPPRADASHLGAVLESGLAWAMRVCGLVVLLLAAGLALRSGSLAGALRSVVVALAGAILVTQHWAAAIALAVVGLAAATGASWREAHPHGNN